MERLERAKKEIDEKMRLEDKATKEKEALKKIEEAQTSIPENTERKEASNDSKASASDFVDFTDSAQLSKYLTMQMSSVTSRTMDLMIMEMRKLDRDRDRVLPPDTVKTMLEKYHIPVASCLETLQDKFADKTVFEGTTNYEDMVRYLEERRIKSDDNKNKNKTDNFILYESEHSKANAKRNRYLK